MSRIHPSCTIDPGAFLNADVEIGAYSIVGPGVELGARTVVSSHCRLGLDRGTVPRELTPCLSIGADSLIRSHTVIYDGCTIGPRFQTGHHVTIREGTLIGEDTKVGSYGDLQGRLEIGSHVRIHSSVFVPERSSIADFVWLFPGVALLNDPHPPSDECTLGPTIEEAAVVSARAVIMPGVRVGREALIGAGAVVTHDVPEEMVVVGSPARIVGSTKAIECRDGNLLRPYPWRGHFHRGYPSDVVARWIREFEDQGPSLD